MSCGEGFEIPIVGLMKVNQEGHDLAFHQLAAALALDLPAVEQRLFPGRGRGQPEIIDSAEQFE
jgi:hypothetical protein